MRAAPQIVFDFLKQAEGLVLHVTKDTGGVEFIGYGHNVSASDPQDITQAQAEGYLTYDVVTAATRLTDIVSEAAVAKLSDHQYAALISFVFNLGANKTWTIWKDLDSGKLSDVPAQIMRFDHGLVDGKEVEVAGLRNRRMAEVTLWNTADVAAAAAIAQIGLTTSSAVTRDMSTPPTVAKKPFDLTATVTKATTVVAALGAGAAQVNQVIAPHTDALPLLGKLVGLLTGIIVAASLLGMAIHWYQAREASR